MKFERLQYGFLTVFLCLYFIAENHLIAQSPEKISYQAVIRDAGGVLVSNHIVGVKVQILQFTKDGAAVYVETHSRSTNSNGLLTLEIGGGSVVQGTFSNIDWANGPYYLKTEIDPEGGTNYNITSVVQILSVPYSLYSKTAGTASDAVKLTGDQIIEGKKTFVEQINAGNGIYAYDKAIKRVGDPESSTDAVNKGYVDNLITVALKYIASGVKDVDGNTYKVVLIGDKLWMAENLKTTKLNDGTPITNVTDASAWSIADYPAYCYYNNSNANKDTYGALYNYYAFNEHKLCPVGWYIPGDSEWNELQNYLISNGYNYDGSTSGNKIAKSLASTDSWTVSSVVGTPGNTDYPDKRNATGFTAVPAGYRTFAGVFVNIGNSALFWSSAWASNDYYYTRVIYHNAVDFRKVGLGVNNGLSVRCVKDIKP